MFATVYATGPVHVGDTSFRRREIVEQSQSILQSLIRFFAAGGDWDADGQREFYDLLREEAPQLFHDETLPSEERRSQRARTNTNPLKKFGFTDAGRRPTPLGTAFARSDARILDEFDELCRLKPENAALLRGLLDYAADTDSGQVFFPVRLLLRLLVELGPLTFDEFGLAFIVGPELIGIDQEALATEVRAMRTAEENLDGYLSGVRQHLSPAERDYAVRGVATPELFPNRKSAKSVAGYLEFADALTAFRSAPSPATLTRLRAAAEGTSLRDRFDPASHLPGLRSAKATPARVHAEARYPGFDGDDAAFRRGLVQTAQRIRTRTLVKEYLDNNLRILAATGVLSVADGTVRIGSAYARAYFGLVADRMTLIADAEPSAAQRVRGMVARFGPDSLDRTAESIAAEHGIAASEVQAFVDAEELARFDRIISDRFPADLVRGFLERIGDDHRDPALATELQDSVSGKASVPCIYEYLIGLSFYYASGRSFDPRKAFGLSLDGDFLPISHAPGGRGDIEFVHDGRRILVEVTLMDENNQRRNELEPVLRHATNLACEFPDDEVLTLFIANTVDANVARIFGFARLMDLTPTDGGIGSASPSIVSMTTHDWTGLCAPDPGLSALFDVIADESSNVDVAHLNSAWSGAPERLRTGFRGVRGGR